VSKLPLLDARQMEKLLGELGFSPVRQRGSHVFYRHADGRTTTLPHHAGQVIARPLLRKVLQDIRLTPNEFTAMVARR
jgi:predicted RNA binding protein YcfA (HicA-like mRNA interferase family)